MAYRQLLTLYNGFFPMLAIRMPMQQRYNGHMIMSYLNWSRLK